MPQLVRVLSPFDESFARDSLAQLAAAGYDAAIRYILGQGKAITLAEFRQFVDAGWSVTLVDEAGQQPALGGYTAGVARARLVMAAADALGLPRSADAACYYVGDDPSPIAVAYYQTIAGFFQGVCDVHATYGGRRVGIYGSAGLINYVMAHEPRVTLAWAVRTWGLPRVCHLIQEPNPTKSTLGGTIDQDTATAVDFGQWPRPTLIPATSQGHSSQEGTMIEVDHPTDPTRHDYVWSGPGPTGIAHGIWHRWVTATGAGQEFLAGYGYNVAARWTTAGHFVVTCDGVDGFGYRRESDGNAWLTAGWVQLPWAVISGPTPGPAGPAGPPGTSYDDSAIRATLSTQGTALADLRSRTAQVGPAVAAVFQ